MAERIGRSAAVKPQTHCWLGASAAERFGAGLIVWFLLLVWMPVWAQSPLKVALVGALTGPKAVYGLSHRDGAHLAAEMIGSRSISLIDIDDAGDSGKVGPFVVDAVMRQQVHALMGSVDSGCTHVLAMVAVKLHVPHVTCVATDPSLTRAGTPWTFRTLADDQAQGTALVEWLKRRRLSGTIAIIGASSRYGRMGARTFYRLAREASLKVLEPVILSEAELHSQIQALLQNRPAVVVVWTLAQDGERVVRELRAAGFNGRIVGGDGLASPAFFADSRGIADGVVVTCPYDPTDPISENQEFTRLYRARYGRDPDSFAAHAYDTVRLLESAWRQAHGSRDSLREALARTRLFRGATGSMGFDETGNDTRLVRLAVCRNGSLVRVDE